MPAKKDLDISLFRDISLHIIVVKEPYRNAEFLKIFLFAFTISNKGDLSFWTYLCLAVISVGGAIKEFFLFFLHCFFILVQLKLILFIFSR